MSNPNDTTVADGVRKILDLWESEPLTSETAPEMVRQLRGLVEPKPATMADVEWIDAQHVGLCAHVESSNEEVRMIFREEFSTRVLCLAGDGVFFWTERDDLTLLPGTKIDLRPGRDPKKQDESTRQQLDSWDLISQHPFFTECYKQSGPLLDAMIAKLDELMASSSDESSDTSKSPSKSIDPLIEQTIKAVRSLKEFSIDHQDFDQASRWRDVERALLAAGEGES